ncbi:glycerol-3-phosphate dehydrogenase/oxidase [Simiduia curdlanivorans]|uniref:FAD-dependent oxidoreductase n=1 Tax=Simiduia curdlanivorans TaxID=1492769 RepID=A0ABV8V251_9GAMM|nr:glycerol-3-phosphate dehydrogenase/oxidase [Simiduia curdlanivorans]MDN3640059.1 glycerol-3-phosphate dehydrogenase/oxidase [Simiduia curdlanivorans]
MTSRAHLWQQLKQAEPWDMVVVGGGITGAGVALAAARQGLRVLLLEQQDYAWGTSSRSSKMVHGGLRYLAQGDINLTRHSLQEREYLIRALPGLVAPMGYYYVLGRKAPPRFAVKILLSFYDWFAGIDNHKYVSRPNLSSAVPGLNLAQVSGAYYYTDAVTDDSRLVQRVIGEAKLAGAHCLNYVKVVNFETDQSNDDPGQGVAIDVVDQCTGDALTLRAAVLVNATGAWADRLRNRVNPEVRVRPQRGSHILVTRERLAVEAALTLMHPVDGRYHFIYPWGGKTVIGTTDLDHKTDLDQEACLNAEEQNYLLLAANYAFPQAKLTCADIVSTWSGVRPIIASDNAKDPSKERRDHAVWVDGSLITVSGGKLTTFRLIALDVLAAVAKITGKCGGKAELDQLKAHYFNPLSVTVTELEGCGAPLAAQYLARYGDDAKGLIDTCVSEARQHEFAPLLDTHYSLADLRWALRYEQVVHLDDLLLRRTHLGLSLAHGAEQLFPALKILCQEELFWSEADWQLELARYQTIVKKYYSTAAIDEL